MALPYPHWKAIINLNHFPFAVSEQPQSVVAGVTDIFEHKNLHQRSEDKGKKAKTGGKKEILVFGQQEMEAEEAATSLTCSKMSGRRAATTLIALNSQQSPNEPCGKTPLPRQRKKKKA